MHLKRRNGVSIERSIYLLVSCNVLYYYYYFVWKLINNIDSICVGMSKEYLKDELIVYPLTVVLITMISFLMSYTLDALGNVMT